MVNNATILDELVAKTIEKYGKLRLRECNGAPAGVLIAVEGVDGSGVSTHSKILVNVLKHVIAGGEYRVIYTKEPTTGPLGFFLWMTLKDYLPQLKRPDILALLFAADRLFHLYEEPITSTSRGMVHALVNGYIVVSDRYKYSSIAYQSTPLPGGGLLDMKWLWEINALAPPAHILIYLDVEPAEAIRRIASERESLHLYESRNKLEMVRENYLRILEELEKKPEWPTKESTPPWYQYMPRAECLYPRTPWPSIIKIREEGKSVLEVADELISKTIETAISKGLLSKK